MKLKLFIIAITLLLMPVFANTIEDELKSSNTIQSHIDDIASNILNTNKITKRIIFTYNKNEKEHILDIQKELTKRQVIIYGDLYKLIDSDDELSAMLSREIYLMIKSYSGMWGGRIDSIQIALSPKKFEIVADKRAVDFMVKAGYNPLGLITYIHKSSPQKRSDKISRQNLASKRLAVIYEYITYKYPEYLDSPEYKNNKHYQNFLLTSLVNRSKLNEKIKTKSTKAIKYE